MPWTSWQNRAHILYFFWLYFSQELTPIITNQKMKMYKYIYYYIQNLNRSPIPCVFSFTKSINLLANIHITKQKLISLSLFFCYGQVIYPNKLVTFQVNIFISCQLPNKMCDIFLIINTSILPPNLEKI